MTDKKGCTVAKCIFQMSTVKSSPPNASRHQLNWSRFWPTFLDFLLTRHAPIISSFLVQVYALLRDHSSVLPQLVACLQAGIGNFSPDVLCIAIDALSRLLATNELASNLFRLPLLLDGAGGIDLLEELQTHQSEEVYSKAAHLIERFFPGGDDDDDDDDDAAADGNTGGGAAFTFGFSENGDGVGGSGGGVGAWSSEDLAELTATLGDLQDSQSNRAVDGKTSSLFCETDEGAELESG